MRAMMTCSMILVLFVCFCGRASGDTINPKANGAPQAVNIADGLSGEVLTRVKAATVYVTTTYLPDKDESSEFCGSGFVVDPSGLIITNAHVAACARMLGEAAEPPTRDARTPLLSITVHVQSGTKGTKDYDAKLVAIYEKPYDLALLRITPDKPLVALDLGDEKNLRETCKVWTVGFPGGSNLEDDLAEEDLPLNPNGPDVSIRGGEVSSLRKDDQGRVKAIEVTCPAAKGNSGGPLIDRSGAVFGVLTYILGDSASVISLPVRMIREQLGPLLEAIRREGSLTPAPKVLRVDARNDGSFLELWNSRKEGDVIEFGKGEFNLSGKLDLKVTGHSVIRGAGCTETSLKYMEALRFNLVKGASLEINGIHMQGDWSDDSRANLVAASSDEGNLFLYDCMLMAPSRGQSLAVTGSARVMVISCLLDGFDCPQSPKAALRLADCSISVGHDATGGDSKSVRLASGHHALFGCITPKVELAPVGGEDLTVALEGCRVGLADARAVRAAGDVSLDTKGGKLTAWECEFDCISAGGGQVSPEASFVACIFSCGTSAMTSPSTTKFNGCSFKSDFPAAIRCSGTENTKVVIEVCRFEFTLDGQNLSDARKNELLAKCCFGIEIEGSASVKYEGNEFNTHDGGIAVRIAKDAKDEDGGDNEIIGPGAAAGTLKEKES
ncbi:MAG: trypsin-like peptidase domain-containing protein [Planctomycetes bacterium]|nr:trypsin-like peptidase domain-containing protein [Planctomycetota bacterium]